MDALNPNLLSHPAFAHQSYHVLDEQKPLIGKALDFQDESNPVVTGRKAILNLYLNRWKGGGNHYEDGPVSDYYIPIFDSFDSNRTMTALLRCEKQRSVLVRGRLSQSVSDGTDDVVNYLLSLGIEVMT